MNKTLVSLDSKGKIRVVEISYDWSPTDNGFVIRRITGQLGGKQTQQPDILVEKGKAGRTVTEQTVLQFNSHLKKVYFLLTDEEDIITLNTIITTYKNPKR